MYKKFLRWLKRWVDRQLVNDQFLTAEEIRIKEIVLGLESRQAPGPFKSRLVRIQAAKEFPHLKQREIGLIMERAVNGKI